MNTDHRRASPRGSKISTKRILAPSATLVAAKIVPPASCALRKSAVRGTLTAAIGIGHAIRTAREAHSDPVDALIAYLQMLGTLVDFSSYHANVGDNER